MHKLLKLILFYLDGKIYSKRQKHKRYIIDFIFNSLLHIYLYIYYKERTAHSL
jgi:hypothetical protein